MFYKYKLYLHKYFKMPKVTYTSTMDSELWDQVQESAALYGITKKEIIETSVKAYIREQKRLEFEKGYQLANKEVVLVEIAEMGMDDYAEQLKKF